MFHLSLNGTNNDTEPVQFFVRLSKQEQTLFKRSTAGSDKVLIVWQSFPAARKQKSSKNILKVVFEVEGVVTHKKIYQKDRAPVPPNYVGRMRSNLYFKVIWQVTTKLQKKNVIGFFGKSTGHKGVKKLHGLSHHYCLQMLFHKDISILKKTKIKVVIPRRRTTTSTVPWSGLGRRQKHPLSHRLVFCRKQPSAKGPQCCAMQQPAPF